MAAAISSSSSANAMSDGEPLSLRLDSTSPEFIANRRKFDEFLSSTSDALHYRELVADLVEKQKRRLLVDLNDLRMYDSDLAASLLQHPVTFLPPLEHALNRIADEISSEQVEKLSTKPKEPLSVGLTGSFGTHRTTPRLLSADLLGRLVCVEGIVTRCSLVRPKVVQSVHYCTETKKFSRQDYTDATSFTSVVRSSPFYPRKDDDGNPLTTEFGLCTYKDHQTVSIQEMPERAPAGELPCSVDVILDADLVDTCKPGDRVQIVGVYRALPPNKATGSTMFRTILIGNYVKPIGKDANMQQPITNADVKAIMQIARRQDVFELLGRSLAPSIFGHEFIKRALVLTLIGGAEKTLENGTHLRGDVNLLMVGDPSTAKSQLLRSVLNIAPLALSTTGRGSSGVGLTAAVTQDRETGERRLEAGAMVLADRGVVCIDEFDKMSDGDRVAIHEVMEQQTVTIAKAGIHTSLNARCSVVAAANPVYGQYDDKKKPHENIGLPDSLLSRFDLLFIVLDQMDPEIDRAIASHVLNLHQFVCTGHAQTFDGADIDDADQDAERNKDAVVFEKYDTKLHGATDGEVLSAAFVKKFIHFIRSSNRMPKLSREASEFISEAYVKLRLQEGQQSLPVTARLLETIIRLSTAHARLRMSKEVHETDCAEAMKILNYAMNLENASLAADEGDEEEAEQDDGVDSLSQAVSRIAGLRTNPTRHRRRTRLERRQQQLDDESRDSTDSGSDSDEHTVDEPQEPQEEQEPQEMQEQEDVEPQVRSSGRSNRAGKKQKTRESQGQEDEAAAAAAQEPIDATRFNAFQKRLVAYIKQTRLDPCPIESALEGVNKDNEAPFDRVEVELYLKRLGEQGRVFYTDGAIYFT